MKAPVTVRKARTTTLGPLQANIEEEEEEEKDFMLVTQLILLYQRMILKKPVKKGSTAP